MTVVLLGVTDAMKHNIRKYALKDLVRKEIGFRIILCVALLFLWISASLGYSIYGQIKRLKEQLDTSSKEITSFVISQRLVYNPTAIQLFVKEYNDTHKAIYLKVFNKNTSVDQKKLAYCFPFGWLYMAPLVKLNEQFGYFTISGSYLNNQYIVGTVLTNTEFALVFMLIMMIVLLPLIKKIPNKIFIDPVEKLIKAVHREITKGSVSESFYEAIEIQSLKNDIDKLLVEIEEKTKVKTHINVARQIAHDMRSPIAAIKTAISSMSDIQESKRIMIRKASTRLNDLANNLLLYEREAKNNATHSEVDKCEYFPELLFVVIDSILSEKRYEYSGRNIEFKYRLFGCTYQAFANISLTIFGRIISNLINNSVESIADIGKVTLTLSSDNISHKIIIEDDGKGIPEDLVNEVTKKGFSYEKESGFGMGLSYANAQIKKMQGSMEIESELNIGTRVKLNLPKASIPSWFCQGMRLKKNNVVAVLDDDESIHATWKERMAKFPSIKIIDFFSAHEFFRSVNLGRLKIDLLLTDYELLGSYKNGLDIIEEFSKQKKAILVTSCHEDKRIRDECIRIKAKIIPKQCVHHIPISIVDFEENNDKYVFIDNDELTREVWILAANEANKDLTVFSSSEEFNENRSEFDSNTTIYIDSDLSSGMRGEEYARKLFHEGFTKIYLTTGFPRNEFTNMDWIVDVIGKEPPFYTEDLANG